MLENNKKYTIPLVLLLFIALNACSIASYIPEGETLYDGAAIETELENDEKSVKDLGPLKAELNNLARPQPNSKVLGIHLGLYYHYKAQKKKPGFLNKWLNKKFGEEPVYFSEVAPQRVEELIQNRLENRGFFNSKTSSEIKSGKRNTSIKYKITLPEPYTLEKYELENDSLPIYKEIQDIIAMTEIKKGSRFNLELMKFERERINNALKQRGYYNFNPDFLIFEADTNRYKDKKFDLLLRLKKNTPNKSKIPYLIDSITVYPNYSITNDSLDQKAEIINDINFVQGEEYFKPELLQPYILFKKNQKYNAQTSKLTSNRLSALGSYKFVNIRFIEKDSISEDETKGALAADIFLSPLTRRALRVELQAVTKSNGFSGPGVALTYSNRNLFKGGETFSLTGNFAFESQISGGQNSSLSSIAGGLKAALTIPRLIPFSPSLFNYAVPKTKITLGVDFLDRTNLFTLTSLNTSFGYTWNANRFVFHELNPISVNLVNLTNTTDEFETILDNNPFLRQSFDQEFIAGLTYTFTYNELVDEAKRRPIFFSTNLDIAGNTLSLLSGDKTTAFGSEYAQFAKVDADFRYYIKWGKEQELVTRLFAGWGVPYGNSNTLPFVKQFFSGGPYSVRAFQIRTLGPGTFISNDDASISFFDQSGNLRLEANMEYRFPIWSYLKGAVFADAGNVWLTTDPEISDDETAEGIAFNERLQAEGRFSRDWPKELGIGVGFGLRVDIQSFVIRLDLASPLQVPSLPEGDRLRTPFFDGGDGNLILNFAIGYPF